MSNYFKPAKWPAKNLEEFLGYLREVYILPLKDLGLEFKGFTSLDEPDDSGGVHILRFERKDDAPEFRLKWLADICDQDDDGQPFSTHRYHNGDLWIFIPYYS